MCVQVIHVLPDDPKGPMKVNQTVIKIATSILGQIGSSLGALVRFDIIIYAIILVVPVAKEVAAKETNIK